MIHSLLSLGCAAFLLLAPAAEERIEARVNDAILTTSELNRMVAPLYRQYDLSVKGSELALRKKQTRTAAIESWIETQLILQEAQSLEGFRIDEMEVERLFGEEKSKFPSPEEFELALSQEGISEREYRKILEDRYKVRVLTFQKITGLITISPRRIIDYYREHSDEFREGEMARISLILIPANESPESRAAARELARSVLGELEAGADFAELARRHSSGPRAEEGGDFGFIERGYWKAQLDEAAFRLEVGEHSGLIETDQGFYIIYCSGKKEASLTPLEDVWEKIEEKLYQQEYQRRYEAWIEDLKSRARVTVGE